MNSFVHLKHVLVEQQAPTLFMVHIYAIDS